MTEEQENQTNEKKVKLGPVAEFFVNTSNALWRGLINEPDQKTQESEITQVMLEKLQQAAREKSIVVLLVAKAFDPSHYETITGWIASKDELSTMIPVRLPTESSLIQMVPLERVVKISILDKNGVKTSVTRGG